VVYSITIITKTTNTGEETQYLATTTKKRKTERKRGKTIQFLSNVSIVI
jgi:translation elongation factor EF-1alpha